MHLHLQDEPHPGIFADIARGVIRAGQAGNMRSIDSPFVNKGRLRAFLKDCLLKVLGNY